MQQGRFDKLASSGEKSPYQEFMPPNNFFRAADLMHMVERYMSKEDSCRVYDAFTVAGEAHDGITRKSGEPYITHPLEVARTLADLSMDADTLCAALLHDVIEDTSYTKEDVAVHFGGVVAELVDGVTKLEGESFSSKQDATIASFQKMMQAMIDDFRVVLIKLADRLHNLRTLEFKKPPSRRRIAKESLAIYVPLARRMGMNAIRREMQLLSFRHFYPWRSQILQHSLDTYLHNNKEQHDQILKKLSDHLLQVIPSTAAFVWDKNLYRIYERIKRQGKQFDEQRETLEIRVLVSTESDCYRALGIVHNLYSPKMGEFSDFIATPKTYGFQALQTLVLTPARRLLRVQIQTRDMYQVAQYGIAAQWRYPDLHAERKAKITQDALGRWLAQVRELGAKADNPLEFYADMQADLFLSEIYAFTPRGDVKEFPRGATMVDFAYAIHTEVGNKCIAALIDGEEVPLRSEVPNGATIEIVTRDKAIPQPSWLHFVATARARSSIRSWLRQQATSEQLNLGERLLDKTLKDLGSSLTAIHEERFEQLLQASGLPDKNELYLAIVHGEQCSKLLAQRLTSHDDLIAVDDDVPLLIKGTSGLAVHFQSCCHPIPRDPIVAWLDKKHGLEIHRTECEVLREAHSTDELLSVAWADEMQERTFLAGVETRAHNVVGVLHRITELMAKLEVNIEDIYTHGDTHIKDTQLILHVQNLEHVHAIIRQLEHVPEIIRVRRLLKRTNDDKSDYLYD